MFHGDFECKVNEMIDWLVRFLYVYSGGRDYGAPLQIQAVNPNSLAERSGMQSNDYILRIGQISTEFLPHKEAQEHIKRQNNFLDLTLQRFVNCRSHFVELC